MMPADEAALAAYQNNRDTDRAVLDALLDECMCPPGYITDLEIVRHCMSEESEMKIKFDIGNMTHGVWDNLVDISNTWAMYPERRKEFRHAEIKELMDAQSLLNELVDEITKLRQEAA